eukprot:6178114-Pleurochrysis_carterae.AAC.2
MSTTDDHYCSTEMISGRVTRQKCASIGSMPAETPNYASRTGCTPTTNEGLSPKNKQLHLQPN